MICNEITHIKKHGVQTACCSCWRATRVRKGTKERCIHVAVKMDNYWIQTASSRVCHEPAGIELGGLFITI